MECFKCKIGNCLKKNECFFLFFTIEICVSIEHLFGPAWCYCRIHSNIESIFIFFFFSFFANAFVCSDFVLFRIFSFIVHFIVWSMQKQGQVRQMHVGYELIGPSSKQLLPSLLYVHFWSNPISHYEESSNDVSKPTLICHSCQTRMFSFRCNN